MQMGASQEYSGAGVIGAAVVERHPRGPHSGEVSIRMPDPDPASDPAHYGDSLPLSLV
jgi:hypothetical protein